MSRYTITTLCSCLWYMCVLLTWVHLGRSMQIFGDYSPHGWLMIFSAFVGSLALNFVLNPLIWIVAGCYIQEARNEGRKSRWQAYPALIGVVLLSVGLASLFKNIKLPMDMEEETVSTGLVAAVPVKRHVPKAPKVSGIMLAEGVRKALIDGYILKEGEEIEGFVIREISETAVTFEAPDGTRIVRRVK